MFLLLFVINNSHAISLCHSASVSVSVSSSLWRKARMQGLGLGFSRSLAIAIVHPNLSSSPSSHVSNWTREQSSGRGRSRSRSKRKAWIGVLRALRQEEGEEIPQNRRRLVDAIRLIPKASQRYFRSPFRRALFGGISLLGGFYVAQTISLSFGALGVNDVIAAVLCVLFTEYVTRFYYSRPRPTFSVALLNTFKMGFSYGLFIDAFKLAS